MSFIGAVVRYLVVAAKVDKGKWLIRVLAAKEAFDLVAPKVSEILGEVIKALS